MSGAAMQSELHAALSASVDAPLTYSTLPAYSAGSSISCRPHPIGLVVEAASLTLRDAALSSTLSSCACLLSLQTGKATAMILPDGPEP